jgi:hypothetical protein
MGAAGVCGPCVFGCISVIAVYGVFVWDCRGLGLCKVGTIG